MTLYRCAFDGIEKENVLRGVLIHRVEKNEEGRWARVRNKEPVTKIMNEGIVLALEVARIVSPFISINLDEHHTSEYQICLYGDETIAISHEKWTKYFVPIETKTEQ